jgi:hypothetical protein
MNEHSASRRAEVLQREAPELIAPEHTNLSKVKVSRNAKGEPQWEISVVVGEDPEAIERTRQLAVDLNRAMEVDFGVAELDASHLAHTGDKDHRLP